jgi:type II secretory pathway component PulK
MKRHWLMVVVIVLLLLAVAVPIASGAFAGDWVTFQAERDAEVFDQAADYLRGCHCQAEETHIVHGHGVVEMQLQVRPR